MSPQIPSSEAYWLPFTSNRRFKRNPVIFSGAQDMYYFRPDGSEVPRRHRGTVVRERRPWPAREIVRAISRAAADLDYASSFQMSHPLALRFADELIQAAPAGFSQVFFSNSGSEAVDTALKIALGYHRARGDGQRVRLIGRERSYHGVGFGGLSVSGIAGHRKPFGNLLPFVDHLPHTYDREKMAYTRGQPEWGAHLADALERIVALHDASTIAAVIVEPVAGSTGVLVPPRGYLQRLARNLRQVRHPADLRRSHLRIRTHRRRVLGFALRRDAGHHHERQGADQRRGPHGRHAGAGARVRSLHAAGPESAIELSHGYTYSGHPVACAAASPRSISRGAKTCSSVPAN